MYPNVGNTASKQSESLSTDRLTVLYHRSIFRRFDMHGGWFMYEFTPDIVLHDSYVIQSQSELS